MWAALGTPGAAAPELMLAPGFGEEAANIDNVLVLLVLVSGEHMMVFMWWMNWAEGTYLQATLVGDMADSATKSAIH